MVRSGFFHLECCHFFEVLVEMSIPHDYCVVTARVADMYSPKFVVLVGDKIIKVREQVQNDACESRLDMLIFWDEKVDTDTDDDDDDSTRPSRRGFLHGDGNEYSGNRRSRRVEDLRFEDRSYHSNGSTYSDYPFPSTRCRYSDQRGQYYRSRVSSHDYTDCTERPDYHDYYDRRDYNRHDRRDDDYNCRDRHDRHDRRDRRGRDRYDYHDRRDDDSAGAHLKYRKFPNSRNDTKETKSKAKKVKFRCTRVTDDQRQHKLEGTVTIRNDGWLICETDERERLSIYLELKPIEL